MVKNKMRQQSICFILDQPGWAFDRNAKNLSKYLKIYGMRTKIYYRDFLPETISEEYIFVSWWPDVEIINQRVTKKQKILCKIADVLTWNQLAPRHWQNKFKNIIPYVTYFIATSREIIDYLRRVGVYNSIVIEDGVDINVFSEKKI